MKHSETYKLACAMNTEKQYSEYKIIDTTITPVYEGAPVETHPEDLLEGNDDPVILVDGGYYLIGCYAPNNLYFGCSAWEDGDNTFAIEMSADLNGNPYLYNKHGQVVDTFVFDYELEQQTFMSRMNAAIDNYEKPNGIHAYLESLEYDTIYTPDSWVVIDSNKFDSPEVTTVLLKNHPNAESYCCGYYELDKENNAVYFYVFSDQVNNSLVFDRNGVYGGYVTTVSDDKITNFIIRYTSNNVDVFVENEELLILSGEAIPYAEYSLMRNLF